MPERLLRWAVGLLAPQRAEWGQAMLGELDYIDGRVRRWRFALGCAGAALLLPPVGAGRRRRVGDGCAAAGPPACTPEWRSSTVSAAATGYAVIDLTVFVLGVLLGASALVRRPGVALPGLLGGLFIALIFLTVSGFTFLDQILPNRWAGTGWCR